MLVDCEALVASVVGRWWWLDKGLRCCTWGDSGCENSRVGVVTAVVGQKMTAMGRGGKRAAAGSDCNFRRSAVSTGAHTQRAGADGVIVMLVMLLRRRSRRSQQ